ncbi:MAG: hypothetical protein ACK4TC_12010 [Sphingomonas pseudosanguinis]|uniref:hypothetical protein n=1 Tax=Sphingomonas pseudosanguinis TaxID=413712 RepID=UPI003919EDB2
MDDASNDLLTGLEAIAAHLGWTARATRHRHEKGELPTFTLGEGRTVYARRSTLAKHFAAQEAAAASRQAD